MLHKHAAELATIAAEIKTLKAKEEELKSKIMGEMKAAGVDTYKSDFGTVSHVTRKTYTYSPEVDKMSEKLKLKKVEEEERGIAEVSVTEFIQINLAKLK